MAKSFIYDSITLLNSTITDGTGSSTFTSSASVTDEDRLIDQSIGSAVSSFDNLDMVRFDLGSSKAADVFGAYFSASETDNMDIIGSDNSDNSDDNTITTITDTFSAGWNVTTFTETTKRYWFIRALGGIANLTEILYGKKLDFDVNPDMNMATSERHGVTLNTSYGGVDYATKRHDSRSQWTLNFSNISSSFKTDLESMRDSLVGPFQPFLYYNDEGSGSYNWVRMTDDSLSFTEVAHQRYSTSISMIQQL